MKNKLELIAVFLLAFVLSACSGANPSSANPPRGEAPIVKITSSAGTDIPYVVAYNMWNGADFDRISTLDGFMNEYGVEDIPYIEMDDTITIDFGDDVPDFVQLIDEVVDVNCERISTELEIQGSQTSFLLAPFPDENIRSDGEQHTQNNMPGLRGFTLVCGWGEDVCEYGFMVNTSRISGAEYDPNDPYLKLVGAEIGDLTEEDFILLLTTPAEELEKIYGLEPPPIPEEGTPEYHLFVMYYNIQEDIPIEGLLFQYRGADRTLPPAMLNVDNYEGNLLGISLPTEFGIVEDEWGKTDRRLYYNPMGNIEKQWQAADYHRDDLVFSFRSSSAVNIMDIGLTQETMFDYNLIRWSELPQETSRVVITLDDDNKFYLLL